MRGVFDSVVLSVTGSIHATTYHCLAEEVRKMGGRISKTRNAFSLYKVVSILIKNISEFFFLILKMFFWLFSLFNLFQSLRGIGNP